MSTGTHMIGLAEVLVVAVIVLLISVFSRRGGPSSGRTTLELSRRGSLSGKTILVAIIAGAVTGVIVRLTGDWMGVVSGGVVEGAVAGGVAGGVAGAVAVFIINRNSKKN